MLTDLTRPRAAIPIDEETLAHSLEIVDQMGWIIRGAFNETMPPLDVVPKLRQDDLILTAVRAFVVPIFALLRIQEAEAFATLCTQYLAFRAAYAQKKVGHHFMVARSDALAKTDTFELIAASA